MGWVKRLFFKKISGPDPDQNLQGSEIRAKVLRANLGIPETKGYEVVPLRNDEKGKSCFTTQDADD